MNGGERFLRFMDEITDGDSELVKFHQVSLGSCLSGAIEEHWLLYWIGEGRNGKNTLGDEVMWLLGDYAKTVPTETLMQRKHTEHATELMNLKGARLVMSSELNSDSRWNESRLNSVTGDETISGRFMRQDYVEFPRTHKHLVYANAQPVLRNVTPAIRARLRMVPFPVSFVGREDPDLKAALRAESGFILNWLIEGHTLWLANGKKIGSCPAVDAATGEYFNGQDHFSRWQASRIETVEVDDRQKNLWPRSKDLYADYLKWMASQGEAPEPQKTWGAKMKFEKVSSSGVRYVGVNLKPESGKTVNDFASESP